MKKIAKILLVAGATVLLTACGNEAKKESEFCGTWNSVSAEAEGAEFTIEELEATGDDTLSDFQIIIKDGGKAYVYSQGNGALVDWKKTEKGIKIGVMDCFINDEMISLENNGIKVNLKKTSDSQTIPNNLKTNEDDEEEDTEIDENEIEQDETEQETNGSSEGIRPEFKEAMDSYEKFFDEYVEFMKKYMDSDDAAGMMGDYADYLDKYTDTMEKMDALGEEEMSKEEALYYAEVTTRITEKLADVI